MGAVLITDRLHRVLGQLDAADDNSAWLIETVRLWQSGAPWEASLGLADGWRKVIQQRAQAEALAGLLAGLPSPQPASVRAQARQIAAALKRYETTTWLTDRNTGRRPDGAQGFARDYLLADGATSEPMLRRALGSKLHSK